MSPTVPPHHENPETLNTAPVFIFDDEAIPAPPGTKARKRPPGREREMPTSEELEGKLPPPAEEK